jgi:D-alanyl-D-alanine carboxypeptidase
MGYGLVSRAQLASVPAVTIVDPLTSTATALPFGPHTAFNQVNFFTDTREVLIAERHNFIEIDVPQRQLRFFKRGILYQSTEIFRVGEAGSWWHVPSGFYQVERKKEREFTTVGQAYLPWVITFQKNFVIHGWPAYPDGTAVPSEYSGGGVRISDVAAESLFSNVTEGTPILVHNTPQVKRDVFIYEPQVPNLKTPHYFIADIKNDTILAATDLNNPAPIASIVKLMTAVVAAEELNLDSRVRVTTPTFVTSLVPRLADRNSVSMYSLLQLLLVESSNEASETIAGEMGREAFIEAMNAKARQLGMLNTQFADPSGLSAENISTIGDLYRLTKYIYENRSFIFEITANGKIPSAYVGGEFGGLLNFNEIEDMDSFVGGKVGETRAAGQTVVSLHRLMVRGEERVLAIILLGSQGRTADVETLLHHVQSRFDR